MWFLGKADMEKEGERKVERQTNMSISSSHMQYSIAGLGIFRNAHDLCGITFLACGELLKLTLELVELVNAGEVDEVVDLFFVENWRHDCGNEIYVWVLRNRSEIV